MMQMYYTAIVYVPVDYMLYEYAGNVRIVKRKLKKDVAENEEKLEKVFRILDAIDWCDCWVKLSGVTEPIEKNGRWISQSAVKLEASFKKLERLQRFSDFVEKEV